MKLKDLVGLHKLSGVDTAGQGEANVVRFILDKKQYMVTEDESDGYRSYCSELEICNSEIKNIFKPQKVMCQMNIDEDILRMVDVKTGKIVLEIGTDHTDSYYPYCVMNWYPQNLACNIGK